MAVTKEALIIGADTDESRKQLEIIWMQFYLGHRRLIRSNGTIITQIAVNIIEAEEPDEEVSAITTAH